MKKFFLVVILAILLQGTHLFAQVIPKEMESEFYFFNFSVEKVYTHRLGYLIVYRNSGNRIVRTYAPLEWFNTIGGKGEIVYLGSGSEWPSMIVYYKNGEFSHLRLRLRRARAHETWGVIPLNANIDGYFKNIEEVDLTF